MLKDSFCSSPWFHVRINHDGTFSRCRWSKPHYITKPHTSILEFYNSDEMREMRMQFLSGEKPETCKSCYYEDSLGKLSGRGKQLLKSAVHRDNFEQTMLSSPHLEHFAWSNDHDGESNYHPVDLQIDLGSLCNSSCIMCRPQLSSRLETEYKKLHQINNELFENPERVVAWTADPEKLAQVVADIKSIPNLKYVHFLGGETLYNEAFYSICEALIDAGIAENVIVGTTTNATIYSDRLEKLIPAFKQFHLGISIETVTPLNDYIRWPSKINNVLGIIDKFNALRDKNPGLILIMRISPNLFTITEFDQFVDFMVEKNIICESCFILYYPESLRVEIMPDDLRQQTIQKLEAKVTQYGFTKTDVPNIRRPDAINPVIGNMLIEYLEFLKNYQVPDNVDDIRTDMVSFLKAFETIHNNSILDYAPQYEQFLRTYGY